MLHIINSLQDPWVAYVKDDPVRPDIPVDSRVNDYSVILALIAEDKPRAMVCVKFQNMIPSTVEELAHELTEFTTAVFYTIWSYTPGAGQELIRAAKQHIQATMPTVNTFVTLSPPTELARRFHLKNGASIYRTNEATVNYQYL